MFAISLSLCPHRCQTCDKSFSRKSDLNRHNKIHSLPSTNKRKANDMLDGADDDVHNKRPLGADNGRVCKKCHIAKKKLKIKLNYFFKN